MKSYQENGDIVYDINDDIQKMSYSLNTQIVLKNNS